MKEVLAAIERHLGRSLSVAQLDYYQVFGLELYCDDPRRIREALQEATNRWLQSETVQYPESAQIVAKLLRQAQGILLDADKRERYNLQLRELRASRSEPSKAKPNAPVSNQEPSHPTNGINSLFPDADPMSPWDFDASTSFDMRTDSRCALLEQIQDPQTRLAELEQLFPSLAEFEYAPWVESNASLAPPPLKRLKVGSSSGSSLTEQILRKRKRRRILVSLAYVFASFVALATAIGLYLNQRQQALLKGKQSQQLAMRDVNARTEAINEDSRAPTKQLPMVQKPEPTAETKPGAAPANSEPANSEPANSEPASSEPANSEPASSEPANSESASSEPANSEPANSMPPSDASPMKQEPMKEDAKPAMASSEPAAESAEWKKRMATTRAAIEKADFETFGKEIEQCLAAQTQPGRDQAARLDQLGQLYKIGVTSFEEAKKKLKGSSALKVGSTQVSIVESTPEKIVLKEQGGNKTYLWREIPFGIAKAIIDLSLDTEKPTDVAARAVFFSLSPSYREEAKTSGIMKKNIEGWFKKSAGQEDIRDDLPQSLTDTYE